MRDQRERLDRLFRALGPDLTKIQQSLVSIIFDDTFGKYFAFPLSQADIPLRLISTAQTEDGEKLIDKKVEDKIAALGYAEVLQNLNESNKIVGIEAELGGFEPGLLLHNSRAVIDCTNSKASKKSAAMYCSRNNIPFFSISVIPGYCQLARLERKIDDTLLMPEMQELEKTLLDSLPEAKLAGARITKELMGMFIAGITSDEVVRAIIGKEAATGTLYWKFGYHEETFDRKNQEQELRIIDTEHFKNKKALVYGAGAIGTNIGYWLARLGLERADFLDNDIVAKSNLMRTLFYHDKVDWAKAPAASQKIEEISQGKTKSSPIQIQMTQEWKPFLEYDIYFDGFDNFRSRNLVHKRALKDYVPLVTASARFDAFDVEAYAPHKTLCLDCNFGLNELAEQEEARIRHSCQEEYTPQNSWLNQSAGSLCIMLMASIMEPKTYGEIINGMAFFDGNQPTRLFVNNKEGACTHSSGGLIKHYEKSRN